MAAADLAPRIRVNGIAAGLIASSATAPVLADEKLRSAWEQTSALQRIGTTLDIASAVLFLVSPAGSYLTGTILEIDGGPGRSNLDSGIADL